MTSRKRMTTIGATMAPTFVDPPSSSFLPRLPLLPLSVVDAGIIDADDVWVEKIDCVVDVICIVATMTPDVCIVEFPVTDVVEEGVIDIVVEDPIDGVEVLVVLSNSVHTKTIQT